MRRLLHLRVHLHRPFSQPCRHPSILIASASSQPSLPSASSLKRTLSTTVAASTNVKAVEEKPQQQHKAGDSPSKRRLDVAIVGLPNAGKSQLLNKLTHAPVSAVSRKRHTTREGVLGAYTMLKEGTTDQGTQLVYVDTPGFLRPEQAKPEGLNRELVVSAAGAMQNVDYTLLVVDAARTLEGDKYRDTLTTLMLHALHSEGRTEYGSGGTKLDAEPSPTETPIDEAKFAIVLNKVDLVKPKSNLLKTADKIQQMADSSIRLFDARKVLPPKEDENEDYTPEELATQMEKMDAQEVEKQMPMFFYTNARNGEGVEDITKYLCQLATPCHEWPVESHKSTDRSNEEQVKETIREKLYRCLHKEVPYNVQQHNRIFRAGKDARNGTPTLLVHQDLVVQTKSHATLVRGSGGRTLETIRRTAVEDLEKLFKCKVNLELQVKLSKKGNNR